MKPSSKQITPLQKNGVWVLYQGEPQPASVTDQLLELIREERGIKNLRLSQWKPDTAAEVREHIAEVIELTDHGILDPARSRAIEQEVLDLLDQPPTR